MANILIFLGFLASISYWLWSIDYYFGIFRLLREDIPRIAIYRFSVHVGAFCLRADSNTVCYSNQPILIGIAVLFIIFLVSVINIFRYKLINLRLSTLNFINAMLLFSVYVFTFYLYPAIFFNHPALTSQFDPKIKLSVDVFGTFYIKNNFELFLPNIPLYLIIFSLIFNIILLHYSSKKYSKTQN